MTIKDVVGGVYNPQRSTGQIAPTSRGDFVLIDLKEPGLFLGAEVTKESGSDDMTFVILEIDGRNVVNISYLGAANWGLTQQNPYGLVLLKANTIKTLTIGFASPLCFQERLRLSVSVKEGGVKQIVANVIWGK